jgi:hypothetical protein
VEREVLGHCVRVSSAEGLIVMKVLAMRPQDEADIRELLAAYGDNLDLEYIRSELDSVMNADDERRRKLESLLRFPHRLE